MDKNVDDRNPDKKTMGLKGIGRVKNTKYTRYIENTQNEDDGIGAN